EELACMLPGAAWGGKLTRSTTLCHPTLSQLRRWRRGRLGNAAETARRERKCAGAHVGSDCCWLCACWSLSAASKPGILPSAHDAVTLEAPAVTPCKAQIEVQKWCCWNGR